MSHVISVGIDVSGSKLDICFHQVNSQANPQFISQSVSQTDSQLNGQLNDQVSSQIQFTATNSQAGINSLLERLANNSVSFTTPIVVEATGSLHWLCCLVLKEKGYQVKVINPLLTKKYERSSIRGSKSDRIDAKRLAEIGLLETDLPDFFDSRETLPLKQYQALLNKLEHAKQELTTSLNQTVKISETIGATLELDSVEKALEDIAQAINVLKNIISKQASPLALELSKISGVSLFQATTLCLATENRTFQTRDQLTAFFGLDIKQKQSGNWRGTQKLSKRGSPYLRKILFQLGWSLSMNNSEYKEYYNKQYKEKAHHYYTAIIATSRKFLRYYFSLLKTSKNKLTEAI